MQTFKLRVCLLEYTKRVCSVALDSGSQADGHVNIFKVITCPGLLLGSKTMPSGTLIIILGDDGLHVGFEG